VDLGVSLVDVPPTVADLLGLDPLPQWRGVSLLDLDHERVLYSTLSCADRHEVAVLQGRHKLILDAPCGTALPLVRESYDLGTDPAEATNLQGRDAPWSGLLLERAAATWPGRTAPGAFEGGVDPGAHVRRRLEALGYAGR
jgi:arylsulfatase A-like enzyme